MVRWSRHAKVVALAALGCACQVLDPAHDIDQVLESSSPLVPEVRPDLATPDDDSPAQPIDDAFDRSWRVHLRYPVVVGYTDFDLGDDHPLDHLATLALVPTADFIRPLSEEWTLIPFLGLGAGWLLNDDLGVLIFTSGVRAVWERCLTEATVVLVQPRLRYDANLNRPDGFLGDWGRADAAIELRHALGRPDEAHRLEPGLYAQGFWFWDDVDFDVPGLAPESIHGQFELGVSLGTREPIEVFGFDLPRVYLGARFGDGAETITLRFGVL